MASPVAHNRHTVMWGLGWCAVATVSGADELGFYQPPDPAEEKAHAAEKNVAGVRLALIAFNVAIWYLAFDPSQGIPGLAALVSVLALVYGFYVVAFRPYERYRALTTAGATTLMDAIFITAWIVATGSGESPFYLLWFVSLAAVAFRYNYRGTIAATGLFVACYATIMVFGGTFATDPSQAVLRLTYMGFAGGVAALIAHETSRRTMRESGWRDRVERAGRAEDELRLLQTLSRGLGRATDLDEALGQTLERAARIGGWRLAEAWVPDAHGAMRRTACWSDGEAPAAPRLGEGEGLPGRAWVSRSITLVPDIRQEAKDGHLETLAPSYSAAAAVPVIDEGAPIAVLTFFMDRMRPEDEVLVHLVSAASAHIGPVFHRKRAEDRYKILAAASKEGLCIHESGVMLEANGSFERLFGYEEGELVGVHVDSLVHPEDHAVLEQRLSSPADETYELRLLRKDGSTFLGELNARDMPYEDRVVRVTAVRDITEQRKAEEAHRLAFERKLEIQQLQQVNDLKTRLLNMASHELNTPLTPLRLQLRVLRERHLGDLNERQQRAVDLVDRNVERLADLVHEILDVARLQGGGLKLDRKPTKLTDIANEIRDMFSQMVEEQGVSFEVDLPDITLDADADRLVQVLSNLVSNALKFTESSVVIHGEVENEVRITVEDDGAGLTEAQISALFEPFSQVHDARVYDVGGTGLGLYICKGIVEQHGGTIHAESEGPALGSRFVFTLPLAQEAPEATVEAEV